MRLPVKLVIESAGLAAIKTGGRLSLGPPEGGTILAQPEAPIIRIVLMKTMMRDKYREMRFIITACVQCKHNSNYLLKRWEKGI